MEFTAADATALSQARLAGDVSIAVAKKIQNNQRQQGQAALDLLATATAAAIASQPVQPGKGAGVDVTG